ncbi:MAG: hypothetical protein WD598_16330 [Acidimicrobiia bacterium]
MRVLRMSVIGGAVFAVAFAAPAAAAPVVLTDVQLAAATLAGADVPGGGWAVAPAAVIEPEPHTQANDIEAGWCGGATDGYAAGELHAAGGATATLQKIVAADQPYWFIWESLHSFQESFGNSPVTQAKNFMNTMQTAATECESWIVIGGEIPNSVSGAIAPFAAIGNQRFAVEITTNGDGVTETTHAVYVRVANNVIVIHTRILPTDPTLLKKIVKKATKKVRQAAAAA